MGASYNGWKFKPSIVTEFLQGPSDPLTTPPGTVSPESGVAISPSLNKDNSGAGGRDFGKMTLQELTDFYRTEREKDMASGAKRGQKLFAPGSLGRLDETRSTDIQNILNQRKTEAQGYSPEELAAYRAQYQVPAAQALEGQIRGQRSAMAASGIRGATATAGEQMMRKQAAKDAAANEREMFLGNINARRTGLSAYEQALRDTEQTELGKKQYNLAQGRGEKLGGLATEMGYASLGAADRTGASQMISADKTAQAMIQAADAARGASGGGKK